MDKFKKMKEEALIALSNLCECNVQDTHDGVQNALEMVFQHGSYKDGAQGVMLVSQWMWADCEERYHAGMSTEGK